MPSSSSTLQLARQRPPLASMLSSGSSGPLTCDVPTVAEQQAELARPPRQVGLAEARVAYHDVARALDSWRARRPREGAVQLSDACDIDRAIGEPRTRGTRATPPHPRPSPAAPPGGPGKQAPAQTLPPELENELENELETGASAPLADDATAATTRERNVHGAYLAYRVEHAARELKAAEERVRAAKVPPQIHQLLDPVRGESAWAALPVLQMPVHLSGDDLLRKLTPQDVPQAVMRGEHREQRFLAVRFHDLFTHAPGLLVLLQVQPGQVGTQDWAMYNPQRFGPPNLDTQSLEPRLLGLSYAVPKRLPAAPAARKMYLALQALLTRGKFVGRSSYVLRGAEQHAAGRASTASVSAQSSHSSRPASPPSSRPLSPPSLDSLFLQPSPFGQGDMSPLLLSPSAEPVPRARPARVPASPPASAPPYAPAPPPASMPPYAPAPLLASTLSFAFVSPPASAPSSDSVSPPSSPRSGMSASPAASLASGPPQAKPMNASVRRARAGAPSPEAPSAPARRRLGPPAAGQQAARAGGAGPIGRSQGRDHPVTRVLGPEATGTGATARSLPRPTLARPDRSAAAAPTPRLSAVTERIQQRRAREQH